MPNQEHSLTCMCMGCLDSPCFAGEEGDEIIQENAHLFHTTYGEE